MKSCITVENQMVYDPKIDFKLDKKIHGCGDSLYGTSNGFYHITRAFSKYKDGNYHEIIVEGTNLNWYQYTDTKIEIELFEFFTGSIQVI